MEEEKAELDVIVTYKLEGRKVKKTKAPVIDFLPDEEAVIVVNILVDEYGNVMDADWNLDGTKGDWVMVLEKTLNVIRGTKFNRIAVTEDSGINHYTSDDYLSNSKPNYQDGEVTIRFFGNE